MEKSLTITDTKAVATAAMRNTTDLIEIRMYANKYPRISYYSKEQQFEMLYQIILAAHLYRGQKADEQNIAFIAHELLTEITLDYDGLGLSYLTFEEIGRAIKRAVLGQGREMFGISVSSLYQVIVDYARGEGHTAQEAAYKIMKKKKEALFKQSALAPMVDAMAGAMVKK